MAQQVQIPRLGWSMEEGVFVEWLKEEGQWVEPGDLLYLLEGEKAVQEIEAIDAGFLRVPPDAPQQGETVLVGQVIAWLCEEDEPLPASSPASSPAATAPAPPSAPTPTPASTVEVSRTATTRRRPASSPRARRVAAELGIDWRLLSGSGRNGRIREADVRAAASTR